MNDPILCFSYTQSLTPLMLSRMSTYNSAETSRVDSISLSVILMPKYLIDPRNITVD